MEHAYLMVSAACAIVATAASAMPTAVGSALARGRRNLMMFIRIFLSVEIAMVLIFDLDICGCNSTGAFYIWSCRPTPMTFVPVSLPARTVPY